MKSYKVEVRVRGETGWYSNELRFAIEKDAAEYGADLMGRWLLVEEFRIAESDDEPMHRFVNGAVLGARKK